MEDYVGSIFHQLSVNTGLVHLGIEGSQHISECLGTNSTLWVVSNDFLYEAINFSFRDQGRQEC